MKKFTEKLNESVDENSDKTAKKFVYENYYHLILDTDGMTINSVYDAMVDFAKLHVEAALIENGLDKDSILNALENIK